MSNTKVTLFLRARTENGWKRLPAVFGKNGKIRPGYALVNDHPVHFPESHYLTRHFEGTRTIWTRVLGTPTDAVNTRERQQNILVAKATAARAGTKIVEEHNRKSLRDAADKYIERAKNSGAEEAAVTYGKALQHFFEAIAGSVRFVDEVDETVMLRFQTWLKKHGNGPRTVFNKVSSVRGFLMWAGLDKKTLGRKPPVEKKLPRAYNRDEVSSMLGAADEYMTVVLNILRMSGLREQEAAYLQWQDLDLKAGILHVRSKPADGFTIKDREERDIPMPPQLVKSLKGWRKKHSHTEWVIGTRNDKPNTKLLLALKGVVRRAGLNCGKCDGCRSSRKECERFTLHAFRRTYATTLARSGMDVHAISGLLGHSDLQTTLKYLASMETENQKAAVNAVKWS